MNTKLTAAGSQQLPIEWEYSEMTYGSLTKPPLIAGDRLVCVTDKAVFALDIYTGLEIVNKGGGFPHRLGGSFDEPPTPTHCRGIVYFMDGRKLIARQLSDGNIPTRLVDGKRVPKWTPPAIDGVTSLNANDEVVVVTHANPDTCVSGFDPATGANPETGKGLWGPVEVSKFSPGPVTATREAIVFVSGGHLFAVNIRSGDTRFDFTPSGTADHLSEAEAPQVGQIGDKNVVVTTGAAAYGVDLYNGKQLWVHRATRPSATLQWCRPAVSERHNLVALANKNNELFVLDLTTGAQKWTAQVPGVEQVSIVGDKVYAGGVGREAKLYVYDLVSGAKQYVLNLEDPGQMGLVTGHGILFTPGEEHIRAIPFGEQNAALFNGESSRITVVAPKGQFDFRQNDLTIETWICTTSGGEIVSGFPTESSSEHHGFRVNVTDQGRLRFAVINRNGDSSFAAVGGLTNVADGSWHHVAVVRRGEGVEMYVDGISVPVDTAVRGSKPLDVNGKCELTIGAFVPGGAQAHFDGLMRELRLWDIPLDAAKLQSRMYRVLTGKEPHMLGYWRMNEADISKLKNHVARQVYQAKPEKVRPFVTELALDTSSFPYLLDQVKLQWPYTGHWSARGENEIASKPALDRSGVLAFGTGNTLYGVLESDGSRAWSKATPSGVSAPVAGSGVFYCVTGKDGLISLDAHTGAITRVEGFEGFIKTVPPTGTYLHAPATDINYIAAASPAGEVWVVEKMKPAGQTSTTWKWKAPDKITGDLSIYDGRIYLTAGGKLYQLDPVKKAASSTAISGAHAIAHAGSVFCQVTANLVVRFDVSDLTKQKAFFRIPDGVVVTGMTAASDLDLLVIATDKGDLHGLTFATLASRWTTRVPAGTASSANSLNAPLISGRTVFCTSRSGSVAAVDAHTGEFRGLFFESTSISTAPVVDSGEIYFGCSDAPAEANLLDGALHSVVFGQTHVLRLGLDRTGAKETARSYVSVTQGNLLKLMGVWECCVEAWVNTKEGGEVLSIAPNNDSRYGLRLWLDRDGKIHFTCVDLPDDAGASWERITSEASSSACDGKWHHVAVCRNAQQEVKIYLDGVALSATNKFETVAQPTLSPGLKVFIGADASTPAPSNFFAGMIGEIRVWDTFLTATRISTRMHDKLIGNEPDLLAYWNFDKLSLQDGSRNGHEGKLEARESSAGYWLADLNFTHPAYPYIETTGRMTQEGTEGGAGDLANTKYELTVIARKGDGTPLANHDVRLWYVRHKGETGPDAIRASTSKGNAQLKAVAPSHSDDESLVGTTGNDGKVIFRIITSQRQHGPSLDLRPAFLPSNERYHVNVLIDSQKLEKPAPPRLEAQATLIQDYHWSTGDTVNQERDRQTWRAVISARNSDGRSRSGERFQLWATEHCEVEVAGRVYPINPNNYQTFTADESGELTVAIAATELRAPKLSVWAGFMHRDERYTIPLDREAHKTLSEMDAEDLSKPRMKNWDPEYNAETDDKALVEEGYKQHAGKVATAIQHVMSVTQEPVQPMRAGLRTKRTRLLQDRRNFGDMRQVEPVPAADGVHTLRTLKHIDRQMPLEPESFRLSLNQELGFEDSIGFVFTKNDLELRPLKSVRQLQTTLKMGPSPEAPKLLGNIFEDAWNAIESAAEAVWREAQRIAIYIADTVTLVVEYADKVVQKVVQSVKEAVEAVVHILKMIKAAIEDVIRFLTTLFDWGAILEAHKILKQIANNQMRAVRQIISRGPDDFTKMLTAVFKGAPPPVDTTKYSQLAGSASSARANDPHPEVQAQVNSVPGKYVNDKVDEHPGEIDYGVKPSIKPTQTVDQDTNSQAMQLAGVLGGSLSDPLGVSFSDMYQSVQDLISGDIEKVLLRMLKPFFADFDKIGKALEAVQAALNAPIEIPFISDLYKWITGEQLTILDVTCLALAIPTHIGYTIYTLVTTGEIKSFADDAKHLKNYQLTAPQFFGEAPLLQTKLLGDEKIAHDRAMHWSYFVFYQLYTWQAGFLKAGQILKGGGEWKKDQDIQGLALPVVLNGLVSKTLLFTAGTKEENWNWFDQTWNTALYAITAGLDIYTAVDAFFLGNEPGSKFTEYSKQAIKIGVSIGGCVLLGLRIDAWVNKKSPQSDLFQTRDVLNAISMMFAFDDTDLFVKAVGPEVAAFVVGGETYVKAAAGCVHIAAVATE